MTETSSWLIGASEVCDLKVTGSTVSGRHCRLILAESGYIVEDLNSTNGTFVNGTPITRPTPISLDDRITLGQRVSMPWPIIGTRRDVAQRVIQIGQDPENDVVIDKPMVSLFHAQIVVSGKHYVISDLGTTNGTAVNSPTNYVRQEKVGPADVIYLGTHKVSAAELIRLSSETGLEEAKSESKEEPIISFSGRFMTLGRDPNCDHVLDFPMISWRHARLTLSGSAITVEDLGSLNGTFVNDREINGPTLVQVGDSISLGSYRFLLTADTSLTIRDFRGDMTLEARDIAIDVPGVRLLEQISLTINPAEFTGLMGPSGAGKTTLMQALNGYSPPSEGWIFLNGRNLYQEFSQFRGQIGYVPQDDIIHSDLTVAQALYFTARLRLPPDFSDGEIEVRIRKVLNDLDIEDTHDVLIGSPQTKGISGGQRKRVNLAMELLTDPSILFLDEPTSGLSSEDAICVMKVLRKLANSGKTILLTIHQPSLEIFQLLDNLVVLSKDCGTNKAGRLAYYGPAYPAAVNFFNPDGLTDHASGTPVGPEEVLRGLARDSTESWVQRYSQSSFHTEFVLKRSLSSAAVRENLERTFTGYRRGSAQWLPLVERCIAIKLKDATNTAVLLAQAPIIAIVIAMVFGNGPDNAGNESSWHESAHTASTTIFLLALTALWFGCSNSVREIVAEWSIYQRERMVNLRIVPYVASKCLVLGGLCVAQCFILLHIVSQSCGLKGPWFGMLILLIIVSMVGVSIGLMVSALVRTSEVAIAILPLILLPMVILGGVMQPLHKMSVCSRLVSYAMPSRWAFESLLLMESEERGKSQVVTTHPKSRDDSIMARTRTIDMAENFFPRGQHRTSIFTGIVVLLLMLFAMLYATKGILHHRDIHKTDV